MNEMASKKEPISTLNYQKIIDKIHEKGSSIRIKLIPNIEGEKINVPVDPYILGVWLGDGSSADGRITTNKNDFTELSKIIEQKYKISESKQNKDKIMDLHTLIQAQMELMGNDQPVASCGLHGATRRDVIEQAIEYLQKSLANTERDELSGYGYRINVEIFKKGKPRF